MQNKAKQTEPKLCMKPNGYVYGIAWPSDYTEGQKGCFVAEALEAMTKLLKKVSERLDAANTPEEDEQNYKDMVSVMWACYGILDDFKFQISRGENVCKAGDEWC